MMTFLLCRYRSKKGLLSNIFEKYAEQNCGMRASEIIFHTAIRMAGGCKSPKKLL